MRLVDAAEEVSVLCYVRVCHGRDAEMLRSARRRGRQRRAPPRPSRTRCNRGKLLAVSLSEGGRGELAHGGRQPSEDAMGIADVVGVRHRAARWIGALVVLLVRGEPLVAADAVQHAGVAVGDLDNIQHGARCVSACLLGEHGRSSSCGRCAGRDRSPSPLTAPCLFWVFLVARQWATELRSRFSPLKGFSQVASPQNCWSVRPPSAWT